MIENPNIPCDCFQLPTLIHTHYFKEDSIFLNPCWSAKVKTKSNDDYLNELKEDVVYRGPSPLGLLLDSVVEAGVS